MLDELDSAEEALHTAHDLLAVAREVRRLAEVDAPGPPPGAQAANGPRPRASPRIRRLELPRLALGGPVRALTRGVDVISVSSAAC